MSFSKKTVNRIVRETLEMKYTNAEETWDDMMEKLSKSIGKPIECDDAGNYNVCECDPYHISIRPIVNDIFDVQAFKDNTDRTKKLYMKFEDLKEFVKDYLTSKKLNYVDSAYEKCVENNKDKEGGDKTSDRIAVNGEFKPVKTEPAKSMNKEEDDPTQPMKDVGDFKKSIDYKSEKPTYKIPELENNLKKLVVKYKKTNGKPRKR